MMGFTLIDNSAMALNISDGAFRLYCVLQSYCFGEKDICFPSQKTLGEKLRRSVRTVQRYIKELVEARLIQVIRRGSNNNYYKMLKKAAQRSDERTVSTIKAAVEKHKNYKNSNKGSFNNFQQRNYNMDKLEKLLLHGDSDMCYEDCLI